MSASAKLFEQLENEKYLVGLDADALSDRAGFYLGEINVLHPFREGNGRAQREFIGQLAHEAGDPIDWSGISRDAMIRASVFSYHSNHLSLAALIREHLIERPTAKSLEVVNPPFEIAAHHRNLTVRDADTLKRDFKGEVVATTAQHIWVQVSDRLAVRYEKNQLDREVHIGEKLAIRYGKQKSQVYDPDKAFVREQGRGFERGRGR